MFSVPPLGHRKVKKPAVVFYITLLTKMAVRIADIDSEEDVIMAIDEVDARSATDPNGF